MVEKILLREMMLMIKVIIIMIKMSNKCHSHVIHVVWLKDRLWCIIQMILLRVIMTWSCSEWYNDSNHVHCNCDTWWKWVISKCHMVTSCKSVGSLTSQGTLQPVKQVKQTRRCGLSPQVDVQCCNWGMVCWHHSQRSKYLHKVHIQATACNTWHRWGGALVPRNRFCTVVLHTHTGVHRKERWREREALYYSDNMLYLYVHFISRCVWHAYLYLSSPASHEITQAFDWCY